MLVKSLVRCPKCQAQFHLQGQAAVKVQAACPKCGQVVQTTLPGATALTDPVFSESAFSGPALTAPPLRSPPSRSKQSASGMNAVKVVAIATGFLVAVMLLVGSAMLVWEKVNADPPAAQLDPEIAHGDNSQAPLVDADTPSLSAKADLRVSGILTSAPRVMTNEEVLDEWFDLLRASEDGKRATVLAPGSSEFESRVQRYLVGDERSRALFRSILVSPACNPSLRNEFDTRKQAFFDKYKFGSFETGEIGVSERRIKADPRLEDLGWKDATGRLLESSFFPLSKPGNMQGERQYLEYVLVMKDFATTLSRYHYQGQPKEVLDELKRHNDSLIEVATKQAAVRGPFRVNQDHSQAEQAYAFFIARTFDELPAQPSIEELQIEYVFAQSQNESPVATNADVIREEWRKVLHPEQAEKERLAKAAADEQRRQANRKAADERAQASTQARSDFADAMRGGGRGGMPQGMGRRPGAGGSRPRSGMGSGMGSGPDRSTREAERSGFPSPEFGESDRGPRGGSPRTGSPRAGSPSSRFDEARRRHAAMQGPNASGPKFSGPNRVELIFPSGGFDQKAVAKWAGGHGIRSYRSKTVNQRSQFIFEFDGDLKELVQSIDFAVVEEFDNAKRLVYLAEK